MLVSKNKEKSNNDVSNGISSHGSLVSITSTASHEIIISDHNYGTQLGTNLILFKKVILIVINTIQNIYPD